MDEQKKTAPAQIVIDDGTETAEVVNRQGKVLGRFVFRPADVGIVDRWNQLAADFDQILAPLTSPDPDRGVAALAEAKTRLCQALDRVFDGNVSEAFFADVHPFALVGDRFYCENVMDAVAGYMTRRFREQFQRIGTVPRKPAP